ncbi:DegV family protein [Lachnospiraceae bacterium 46-15]
MDIDVLPLKTMFGDEEFLDGVTLNHQEFFEKLIETGIMPTTSQLTPYEYEEKFREIKEAGDTAVCITISSKLSGCYQSACVAAEDYEDCITVVDSQNVSLGEQILVEYFKSLLPPFPADCFANTKNFPSSNASIAASPISGLPREFRFPSTICSLTDPPEI